MYSHSLSLSLHIIAAVIIIVAAVASTAASTSVTFVVLYGMVWLAV